ncbi:PRC-barrel domain containing protein [Falsiroseomonas tokyonensis]|uniref:PRC-barrel domain-containing protein n=1 Tax=Falsiroseomonas tokyonensis TaxID=430521 RepID=A0ABV7BRB1_9PROT|nr:PRC-barrel domain-containing protein [Falsiroseomonas tokyonensis]MBU8536577.1 PRC-barrel domain-containing protein [Falsiroseomonas tokyonensis]
MAAPEKSLWRSSTLIGASVKATDDSIGSVHDILFDDQDWAVRWLVVDTGSWLPGRKVLLPTSVLGRPDTATGAVSVTAVREQVKDSPGRSEDEPVSRQMETEVYGYYGWSPYWHAGTAAFSGTLLPVPGEAAAAPTPGQGTMNAGETPPGAGAAQRQAGDPHLRSMKEVTGYYIRANDDDIGHVEEFLLDEAGWAIRYIVVDTRNWWPGKQVLLAPKWIREVDWGERKLRVDITREQVEAGPDYTPTAATDRAYEQRLYAHYGQIPYWI